MAAPKTISKPLVSFVIPAYNAAPYLSACLDSIFAIPMNPDDYEIVAIDDGSTDETPQILARTAAEHNNVRCFRQQNQGQSVARNFGISQAQGEYVYFVDADDTLADAPEFPLPAVGDDGSPVDIIGVEVLSCGADGRVRPYCRQTFPYGQLFAPATRYLEGHNVLGIVYGYLFRRDFLRQAGLRFTPGIYHQDEEFIVRAFCAASSFLYAIGYTYIYYAREGSSIHTYTKERRERLMADMMTVISRLADLAATSPERTQVMRYKLAYMAADVLRLLVRQRHTPARVRETLSELRRRSLYPLSCPVRSLREWRFIALAVLTATERRVNWWIRHPKWAAAMRF